MDTHDPVLQRLDALEIKACHTDDLLEQLNLAVYRQQQQIDALLRQLDHLRRQLPDPAQAAPRSLRDDLPPHY